MGNAVCGDGVVEGEEACDDGNSVDDDGCRNACREALCGDGIVRTDLEPGAEGFEACEDSNSIDEDACTNGCQLARCGDGILRAGLADNHPTQENSDE